LYVNGITSRALLIIMTMFGCILVVGFTGLAIEFFNPNADTGLASEVMKWIVTGGTSSSLVTAAGDVARELKRPGSASHNDPLPPIPEPRGGGPTGSIDWGKKP